jgi:GT2 family glycosyltransferase
MRTDSVAEFVSYDRLLFKPTFTIAVLLYGDYLPLAQRCIDSILKLPNPTFWELRIGMNAVSAETYDYVNRLFMTQNERQQRISLYNSVQNIGKYKMMRRILYDEEPAATPYFMWFDDDSYLTTADPNWLNSIEAVLKHASMCGSIRTTPMLGGQAAWVEVQPWYRGKPLVERDGRKWADRFAVGGWWTIHTRLLHTLDWPPKNIVHLGGDYMLGEALRQNGYTLAQCERGVRINDAKRRGVTKGLCGIDYSPPLTMVLHRATSSIPPKLLDYPGL